MQFFFLKHANRQESISVKVQGAIVIDKKYFWLKKGNHKDKIHLVKGWLFGLGFLINTIP